MERPLGVLAAMNGEWGAAEGHFTRAVEINSAMGGLPWVAHAQHDFARALIERDDPERRKRALELLGSAVDTYRALAMSPWLEQAEADQRRIEGIPDPG